MLDNQIIDAVQNRLDARMGCHINVFDREKIRSEILEIYNGRVKKLTDKGVTSFSPEIVVDDSFINSLVRRIKDNVILGEYYSRMAEEAVLERDYIAARRYEKKAAAITGCSRIWSVNYYEKQGVKDILKVNHCHDKFCKECATLIGTTRQLKFEPVFNDLKNSGCHLYMLTLTCPNVDAHRLLTDSDKNIITANFHAVSNLVRYFSGNSKIKGLDFEQLGYKGCTRSLEVTASNGYHVHLHCILVTRNPIDMTQRHENKYSFSRNNGYRRFSDFEILLQKIWYLLLNGIKVTKSAIDELPLGYSGALDEITDNYHEAFKYTVKPSKEFYTYEVFKTLEIALFNRRVFQGYGVFRGVVTDENEIDETADKKYDELVAVLNHFETPKIVTDRIIDVVKEVKFNCRITYINRKKVYRLVRDAYAASAESSEPVENLRQCLDNLPYIIVPFAPKSRAEIESFTNYHRELEAAVSAMTANLGL